MGRSHKETNVHRFQNFSERIALMHIDVVHQIRKGPEEADGEQSTFFGDALATWVDLNSTQHFADFQQEVASFPCTSYVQLVHHGESIIATLKKHLLIPKTLALEPLLDLVVQVGRDMGPDFYVHFKEIFDILVQLLSVNAKDPDSLEKIFYTMAYLFKFLWRYLVQDIHNVYSFFSSLLTENYKEYIQKFAAESFAFLMRKVKDHDAMLDFIFMDLKESPNKTTGVGQLLFEMMKGVKQHFHSISDKIFASILHKLGPKEGQEDVTELPWSLVEAAVGHMMQACASYTSRDQAQHMWETLLSAVSEAHRLCRQKGQRKHGASRAGSADHLSRLLRMMTVWLHHADGSIVSNPIAVLKVLSGIAKEPPLTESIGKDLLTAVSTLVTHSSSRLSVEDTTRLMSLVFAAEFAFEDIKNFVTSLLTSPLFEKDVLPGLLSYITRRFNATSESEKGSMLRLVADFVLQKMTVPEDGSQLEMLHKYSLDFGRIQRGRHSSFLQYIQSAAGDGRDLRSNFSRQELEDMLAGLVCLPHISVLDANTSAKAIASAWSQLNSALSQTLENSKDEVLFVIHQAVLSLLVLKSEVSVPQLLPFGEIVDLLRSYPTSASVLHAVDLYLSMTHNSESCDLLTLDLLLELYPLLEPNLTSSSHKVRLFTLHILTLFPVTVTGNTELTEEPELSSIFTVSLEAERVPLSVQDYRRRLMYLRKLDHGLVHTIMPAGPFNKTPLLYLLGTLHCPMTLLWEPVCQLIATHAQGLGREEFWDAFSPWLKFASKKSAEVVKSSTTPTSTGNARSLLDKWVTVLYKSERPADYTSFRDLLWKAMSLFPEKCEPKSRDVVPLFIDFLEKEYYLSDLAVAPTQNIHTDSSVDVQADVSQDTSLVNDDNEDEEEEGKTAQEADSRTRIPEEKTQAGVIESGTKHGKVKRKSPIQSLLVHLELFAKFQNPRSLYQETALRDVFFQFLEHKHSKVQKVAFDCVMTYRYKYLTPYRENFERLLDDKTFKTEVVLFSVDAESSEIKAEHRQDLLPVLMRILYGKMLSKVGTETSGKRRVDTRRSIVFRFLAGCLPHEMQYFLDLVFGPFKHFVSDDPGSLVKTIMAETDLTRVVPPKRMKGVLGGVVVVMEKLGHLLASNARSILHLLVGMAATCNACLRRRLEIHPAAVTQLKSVRLTAFTHLIEFFSDFDKYEFTESEVDAILEAFVRPQLDRLTLESKCQPSSLLKLFQCWSLDPRHFFLLMKEPAGSGTCSLAAMFSLLTTPGVGPSVSAIILKTVENLLEAEEDAEEEPPQKKRRKARASVVSEGVLMVRPFVPALLAFIEGSINSLGAQLQKSKKGVAPKENLLELKILARVSPYIEDEQQSVRLCSLLMPFLSGSIVLQQDLEESTLESVLNLMKTVQNPQPFYRSLLPLFMNVERRQSRALLCQILKVIGEKLPVFQEVADIVDKLNAWDARQAEEPDYRLRLEMFRLVVQHLREWVEVDVDFLLPIIYNCFFFIKNFDDLSLRDNSTHCLVTTVQRFKALTSDLALYKEVIVDIILPNVKKGLRSKQEKIRHEMLAVLQALVLAYPEHRDFIGLSGLRDTDVDSDFFENIRHIQIHKQTKALRRLSRYLHTHKLRADQHMGFFVPLLYAYLLDQRYAKSGGLLDASVDLTCMICRQLPWENYFQLLRLYLSHLPRHLETQRTIIKVIVAIMDGFHFDLSQSQFTLSNKPEVVATATSALENTDSALTDSSESTPAKTLETLDESGAQDAEEELSSLVASAVEPAEEDLGKQLRFSADRKDICAPGLATRIHRMLLQRLIPQLHKTLTEKVKSDEIHKMAQTKYAEDEEILRVPIAMAMIKLLQKLPGKTLEHKLPGILLRVCNFLKSRAQDIRTTARDTLVKAVQSLGPRFLPFIVKEMRSVLTRGYQRHVLSFSVHYVLHNMLTLLKPGDLDPALDDLHAVFQEELFGGVSEEKDVEGIKSKLFEAKTIKGYLAYEIIAHHISPDCLGALMKPLKMVLEKTHSQRTANKVRLVLQRVNSGLISNSAIPTETMMVFVHSLTADNLPLLREEKPSELADSEKSTKPVRPQSCLILPPEIPRGGVKPKGNKKTTLDVLVEFGLLLLHACLKKGMLEKDNSAHLGLLDPLVPSLLECLTLKHVRVNSATLRCLCWVLTFPLPSLKEKVKSVAKNLFVLLRNYASAGAAKGDNQELVFTCFKAVTVLVREVRYYELSTEHLQVLLTFCEEDIHDHTRQSTAFSVLKAILQRKLNVPELHELMSTIEGMSITAEAPHLRLQCRQVMMQYFLDYPLGKKLHQHIQFYLAQLSYEREEGRQSALEIFLSMFNAFPQHTLQQNAGLVFVPLSVTLVNDESEKCRKMASLALKTLLEKVDVPTRDSLFSLTFKWMTDRKVSHRKLSAQLCGLFVEVEAAHFEHVRLSELVPLLRRQTDPVSFEKSKEASEEQERDHWLFNLLTLLSKILRCTNILQQDKWTQDTGHILDNVREHLLYPHSWVRLVSCQIFGQVFAATKQDEHEVPAFLTEDTRTKMKKLVQQMCNQLQSPLLDEELASQVVKNLVFLTKLYHQTDQEGQFSLGWLARKLSKEANYEKIHNPKVMIRRNYFFKWVAAVSLEFSSETIKALLPAVLLPLQREAEDNCHDETLKTLAQQVLEILKKKVGVEEFSAVYTSAQQARQQKKEARKIKRAVDAVKTPEVAARKRMKKTIAKQEAKKRKIDQKKQRVKKSKLSIYQHDH